MEDRRIGDAANIPDFAAADKRAGGVGMHGARAAHPVST
jgi:hypothetical protein